MCEFPEYDVNEIVPNLWLGNLASAYDRGFLHNYKIKHILTIYEAFDNKYKYKDINYLVFPIRDKDMCGNNMNDFFDKTSNFIYQALQKKEGVLVHCKKGHHRSAAATAAFLIKYYKFEYDDAVKYINNDLFIYNLHLKGINKCNMKCQTYDRSTEHGAMNGMRRYGCHCT